MENLNVMIEVTRRCNMECIHCLRGEAQQTDIDPVYLSMLLDQVKSIGSVTFTGGEPSLNYNAITLFLSIAKAKEIPIESFYIATNGMVIPESFVTLCLRLYSYCDDKKMCRVDISNDAHHKDEGNYDTTLLDGLSFVHRKYSEEGLYLDSNNGAINEGRFKENFGDGRELSPVEINSQEDMLDTEIYLNVNGDIVAGCDWSYASQEDNILCRVDDLREYIDSLPEYEEE